MDVAQVSVLASSVVALVALLSQSLAGRGQRRHEARLAYEQRVWDRKSDALFQCIGLAREAADALAARASDLGPPPEDWLALHAWENAKYRPAIGIVQAIEKLTNRLEDAGPVIESFGSDQVRQDLLALRRHLRGGYYEYAWVADVRDARAQKEQLIDAQDFEGAAHARERERKALKGLSENLTVPAGLDKALLAFIESARSSIRSD